MKDILKKIKLNEGNISTLMGVVVMILTGFLLVQYFKTVNKTPVAEKTLSTSTDQAASDSASGSQAQNIKAGSEYTVQPGDSLWNISVKTYGAGDNWSKIYEANKDKLGNNPSLISAGTKIVLPGGEIAQSTDYTVKKDDNLWKISTALCGSGYSWTSIASGNHLANPGLIHPGNVLKVTCPKR